MHLRPPGQVIRELDVDPDIDLSSVYPVEDRILLRSALWFIHHATTSLKSVNDLALRIGHSEREINRVFSEHLGQTAFTYIRRLRIEKAKQLLRKTRYPVTHIAQEVGYSSSANFSTAFKSVVGMTPRDYRRQGLLRL